MVDSCYTVLTRGLEARGLYKGEVLVGVHKEQRLVMSVKQLMS